MDPRLSRVPTTTQCVTVIDGSAGLRMTIAAIIKAHFPDATIEDIDPFSQTMRGAGLAVSSRGSAIVLGGVGTEAEANDALKRLRARSDCPPVVMLVAESLIKLRPALIAGGAFEVLRKDAISGQRLRKALQSALSTGADGGQSLHNTPIVPLATPFISADAAYGKFMFNEDGDRVGIEIDGYRPLETISSGAMSQVYLAEPIGATGQVVVKTLTSVAMRNVAELSQIITVTQRLRPLRGGAVVRELDSGVSAGYLYAVLEFLTKGDLRRRLKKPMDNEGAVRIIIALLQALAALHEVGVCHADLKPESIFFREDGSVTLIDFNISTLFGHAVRNSDVGDALGTPTYMSPEQGAGRPVDGRSDLYAAGIILFEMLTGAPPFVGDTAAQTIFRHLHDEVPLLPLTMRYLQPVVDKLLAKSPSDRFQQAGDVIAELTALSTSERKYAGPSSDAISS
jgi:tRNA A-37 threonylcarbamoyl transferase component Bud32/DNA-binding NarL/FixJ family response regulator